MCVGTGYSARVVVVVTSRGMVKLYMNPFQVQFQLSYSGSSMRYCESNSYHKGRYLIHRPGTAIICTVTSIINPDKSLTAKYICLKNTHTTINIIESNCYNAHCLESLTWNYWHPVINRQAKNVIFIFWLLIVIKSNIPVTPKYPNWDMDHIILMMTVPHWCRSMRIQQM